MMSEELADASEVDATQEQETPEEVVARETAKSPRRAMCAAILTLQSIALGLSTPVMVTVAGVPTATALMVGLGLAVLSLLTAGLLRKSWGYHIGSLIQVAAIGLGFVVTMMFVVGGVFAILWFGAIYLGRKIEREKSAAWHLWLAEQQG